MNRLSAQVEVNYDKPSLEANATNYNVSKVNYMNQSQTTRDLMTDKSLLSQAAIDSLRKHATASDIE